MSEQNNTNSSNSMLPSGFTVTANPIGITKPVTKVPIKHPKDWSSEEIFDHDEKQDRSSEGKKRKREKKRKRARKIEYEF